VKCI